MGGAPMAYALWSRFLKHCPDFPDWPDRDRFVLSAGHGSMLLYALLHLAGYDLSLDDLKNFRQLGSKTPGHPEYGHTPGVETTTGPLGQGFANAVGMALAEKHLAAIFNRPGFPLVDHHTYVYSGDGCMMEGITSEAASLAGHLKLGKLICLYDDNNITIDGRTDIAFTEDTGQRFKAYGWQVLQVKEGDKVEAVEKALAAAKEETEKPTLVMVNTKIGYGSPNKEDSPAAHGAPLGASEVTLTKKRLGWPLEPHFHVPPVVYEHFQKMRQASLAKKEAWDTLFAAYTKEHPGLAQQWQAWHKTGLPADLAEDERLWDFDEKPAATRSVSGKLMQIIYEYLPNMIGGSADLNASTKTGLLKAEDFQPASPAGSNINFGVREHAMGGILSGLSLHGGLRPFGSTFLVFFDYMKPAVRLAAMMGLPVTYVYTHDSVAVGEDGPTHQPVEHLANLRSIPNLHVLRPADGKETAAAWVHALSREKGPAALILSRQNLPQLAGTGKEALKGGYIVAREKDLEPDLILVATGSELALALEAQKILEKEGQSVRVVSMMCLELFLSQDKEYVEAVLPSSVKRRIVIEAGLSMGWESISGPGGRVIGLDGFGLSAPGDIVMREKGISVEAILDKASELKEKGQD